jgi:hypothetical protein
MNTNSNAYGLFMSGVVGLLLFIVIVVYATGGNEDRYHEDGSPNQSVLTNGKE